MTVYHIQQSVEKSTKAFCLASRNTTPEQLTNHHRSPLPILQLLKSDTGEEIRGLVSSIGQKDYKKLMHQANRAINSDSQNLLKVPFIPIKDELNIRDILNLVDALSVDNPLLKDAELKVKAVFIEYLPEYKDSIERYNHMIYAQAAMECYLYGLITYQHESTTRYPGHLLEPADYQSGLGIVDSIPELIERAPKTTALVHTIVSTLS